MSAKLPDDPSSEGEFTSRLAWRRAVTETRAVLKQASAAWARHSCPGSAECCQLAVTKRPPWLWPSEWKVIEERLRRDRLALPAARADGACPLLDAEGKRCTVYQDRPLGCRTFFCARIVGPSRLPADETNGLMERLKALNLAADDEAAPRSILEWVRPLPDPLSPPTPSPPGALARGGEGDR